MTIVGIDEAGRGCWAGPLVAAAVVLGPLGIDGLTDSKQLSAGRRQALATIIRAQAAAVGIGWVSAERLDGIGLTAAVRQAMSEALAQVKINYQRIIIDGNYNFLAADPLAVARARADSAVPAVSAASIVAKTARDDFMAAAALQFPQYGFDRHVGYGTALHLQQLRQHGPCALHRLSYKPLRQLASRHV